MITYEPLSPAMQADPYPSYAVLRQKAPVLYVDSLGAFVVSRHADVRTVMRDHARFSSQAMAALVTRPIAYNETAVDEGYEEAMSIIGTDGATHERLRTIVNRGFTPRRVGRLEVEVRALARDFVQRLVAAGAGDLLAGVAVPFPIAVIAALLGVDPDRRADFRRWSEQMVIAVFEPASAHDQVEIARCNDQMGEWIEGVIAERTGQLGDDLVSVLLRAELEGGALSAEELRVFVITLLVAGSITTAYLIGDAALALACDPVLQARARTEPGLVARIIDESLRYDSPVQMMFRTATERVEIAGVTVPEGATVVPLIGSANRDERVFPDPDRFDPERDTGEHLSFGHGVHFCLGAALAKLEARIAIEELLAATPRVELAGEVDTVTSLVFRGPTRLPLDYN